MIKNCIYKHKIKRNLWRYRLCFPITWVRGHWNLRKNTGIVQDAVTAVDIDDERTALVLVSLTPDGNICTERTYYAMICEIDATACKVTFHVTDDVA